MRQPRTCLHQSLYNVLLPALWRLLHTTLVFQNENRRHENISRYPKQDTMSAHKYANTEMQTTCLCTQNCGGGSETCLDMLLQQVNYSLFMHLVLCLNKLLNELDIACRLTYFLWDKRWLRVLKTVILDPSGSRRSRQSADV